MQMDAVEPESEESDGQLEEEATECLLEHHANTIRPPPSIPSTPVLLFRDYLISPTAHMVLCMPGVDRPTEGAIFIHILPPHFVLLDLDAITRADQARRDVTRYRPGPFSRITTESRCFELTVNVERLGGHLKVEDPSYTERNHLWFAIRSINIPTATPTQSPEMSPLPPKQEGDVLRERKKQRKEKYEKVHTQEKQSHIVIKDPERMQKWLQLNIRTSVGVHYDFNPIKFIVKVQLTIPEDVTVTIKGHVYFK
jgi:hypothetical protein